MLWPDVPAAAPAQPAAIAAVANGAVVVVLVAYAPRRVQRNQKVIQVLQRLRDNVKQKPRRERGAAGIRDRVAIAGSMGDRIMLYFSQVLRPLDSLNVFRLLEKIKRPPIGGL